MSVTEAIRMQLIEDFCQLETLFYGFLFAHVFEYL